MTPEQATAFLESFAELVAAKVLAKMAAPVSHYGTGRAATLPPGKSRAWALSNLKTITGAKKVGRDWIIAVADYDAWVSEQATTRALKAARPGLRRSKPANDAKVEELLEKSLAANGLRLVR